MSCRPIYISRICLEDPGPIAAVGEGSTDEFTKSYINKTQMQPVVYFLFFWCLLQPPTVQKIKILCIYFFCKSKVLCVSPKIYHKYMKLSMLDSEFITVAPQTSYLSSHLIWWHRITSVSLYVLFNSSSPSTTSCISQNCQFDLKISVSLIC